MAGPFATDLRYDVANRSNHNIWWNATVVAVLYDDLSSASGKPCQFRFRNITPILFPGTKFEHLTNVTKAN
jgi:hypothetical protein